MPSLVSMEIRPLVRGRHFWLLIKIPDANLATVRKLRGWASTMSWTAVDLHRLCLSYRCVGAMGLPRDIIEQIIHFHRNDTRTLKACSLICRAFFSVIRGLIHGSVRLSRWKFYPLYNFADRIAAKVLPRGRLRTLARYNPELHMKHLSVVGKHGLLGYAREVDIDIGHCLAPEDLETYLPHFHSFTQVHTLRIDGLDLTRCLPAFGQYFTQFVPTLRSLHLHYVMGSVQGVLEFVCKFPHLDDLSLPTPPIPGNRVDVPPRLSVEQSPPLTGILVLGGSTAFAREWFLPKIPGGLHFRSIYADRLGKKELDGILAACSSELRTFSLGPRSREFTR